MRRDAGVTLVELLIAITLLSLLSAGMLFAMRIGFDAMGSTNRKMIANRRSAGSQRVLDQQIAGLIPARGMCAGASPAAQEAVPFFQGEWQTMRFVSSYSLQEAHRGAAQILEYQVMPGANGEGVRLVVNEIPYAGPFSTLPLCVGIAPHPMTQIPVARFRPVMIGPSSFVIADRLAFCRFSFKEELPGPPFERWTASWGMPKQPAAIRVEMAPLALDPSRLQILSLTVRVRPERDPTIAYNDIDPRKR